MPRGGTRQQQPHSRTVQRAHVDTSFHLGRLPKSTEKNSVEAYIHATTHEPDCRMTATPCHCGSPHLPIVLSAIVTFSSWTAFWLTINASIGLDTSLGVNRFGPTTMAGGHTQHANISSVRHVQGDVTPHKRQHTRTHQGSSPTFGSWARDSRCRLEGR